MKRKLLVGTVCIAAAVGCSKKESNNDEAESGAKTQVGDKNIESDPLAALNLSSSLSPEVPSSVTASGAGVQPGQVAIATLTARKKSREACNIRQKIREAKMNQEQMAMDLCFVESQKGMKAGGKYKMTFKFSEMGGAPDAGGPGGDAGMPPMPLTQGPDGGMFPPDGGDMPPPDGGNMPDGGMGDMPGADGGMAGGPDGGDMPGADGGMGDMGGMPTEMVRSVYLDNSDPNNFKVYMCDNDKLTQKIVLNGAGSNGSKGTYKAAFEDNGLSIAMVGSFDNGVGAAGRQRSTSQMAFSMKSGSDTINMRSNIALDLAKEGVSVVKVANESSMSASDFSAGDKEIGVALIGPNIGSALFQRTFTGSDSFFPGGPGGETPPLPLTEGTTQVETSRAFFDSAGQTLEQKDSDSFKEGGQLHAKESMFPKLLPENFTVTFEAGDWDCSGTEDFAVDMNSPELKACEKKFASAFQMEECDGDTFAVGMEEEEIGSFVDQRGEFGPPDLGELPPGIPGEGEVPPPPPAE